MNVDAQEAALGLLSMGHNYLSQPIPSTSSATLNSILTTTASPVIPQKRKQSDIDQPEFAGNHVQLLQQQQQQQPYLRLTHSPPPGPSSRANGAESNGGDPTDTSTETVDCICGFAIDDGFSIACDECSRWCHSACFAIAPGCVPEKFACWTCKPRSSVEKERAVRLQRDRLGMADGEGKEAKQRRRNSPASERRQRRGPNAATAAAPVDGSGPGKRKRRPSITQQQQPPTPTVTQPTPNGVPEEEQVVDVDNEPWKEYYVHIAQDIIPNDDTRTKLRHQAVHWRGVTAVSSSLQTPAVVPSSSLEAPPPVSIKPLSQSSLNPFLSQNSNPHVLPPAFSLHTTHAIPSHSLITPFHSCITPSSTYLADPLNAYAHLGMPKPYVHLLGPPLDVALDARIVGNHGRFARWGCKPNAVLRPIVCERGSKEPEDESTLGFGVFATKDMKANEEIVLGWEWDDGNAVHLLPALLESPDTFPLTASSLTADNPHKLQHIKNQMSNILHALSSTFTTCACGALSKDCALSQMAAFVDGHDLASLLRRKDPSNEVESEDDVTTKVDIGPLVGRKRGFRTKERIPHSGGLGGMQMVADENVSGSGRGFVWDGMRYTDGISPSPRSPGPTKKGKERALAVDEDAEMVEPLARAGEYPELGKRSDISIDSLIVSSTTPSSESVNNPPSEPRPPDPPDRGGDGDVTGEETEEQMPPRLRKKWMHRLWEARKELLTKDNQPSLGITVDLQDEHHLMPPPPMPASMDPTTISSTSVTVKSAPLSQRSPTRTSSSTFSDISTMSPPPPPSSSGVSPLASFAQLSLLSPALSFEIPSMPLETTTQHEEKPEIGSEEVSKTDTTEPIQAEASVVVSSPPPPTDSPAEDHGSVNSPQPHVLDLQPPGFSRTLAAYSRRHDEDDEVDYSPHSPEPAFEDVDKEDPLQLLHTNSPPPEVVSHLGGSSGDNAEPHVDDQITPASGYSHRTSPDPSQDTKPVIGLTNPELEPSPTPSSQQLQQSPPPHPQPKVKLTLKDFALRKKRQREEQALSQASPVTPSPILPPEGEEDAKTPNIVKTQLEYLGRGDCVIIDELHPVKSPANNRHDFRHSNGAEDESTLEIKSPVVQQQEYDSKTSIDVNEHPFPKFPSTLGTNGRVARSHILPNWPPAAPLLLPSRQPTTTSKTIGRETKQELIEALDPPLLQRVSGIERSISPIGPDPTPVRIPQEEDGEIGEIHLGPRYGPSGKPIGKSTGTFVYPPPIGPRFYLNQPTSPPSGRPTPPSVSPIPAAATATASASANNTNGNRPNLPTGPRAFLRLSMLHNRGPPPSPHPPSLLQPPSHETAAGIPRGPSADRDKERERADWERRHYRGLPRRGTGNGRGAAWGR